MKYYTKSYRFLPILLILVLMVLTPAMGQDCVIGNLDEDQAEIERLEDMLARSCDPIKAILEEMIKYGEGYQRLAQERAETYSQGIKELSEGLSVFSSASENQPGGQLMQEFNELKAKAEEAGLLAKGPRPKGISYIKLSMMDGVKDYLFFEKDEAKAQAMTQKRWALEEAWDNLRVRWDKARDEFHEKYSQTYFEKITDKMETPVKTMFWAQEKYRERRDRLMALAESGKYEHCLGPISLSPQYETDDMGLYKRTPSGELSSLPGAGFIFPNPKAYPGFPKKINLPSLPPLYLKHDGERLQKANNEIAQEKIRAEEEQMQILADWDFGLGKYIIGERNMLRLFYAGQTVTETVEALSMLAEHICNHPIDSVKGAMDALGSVSFEDINKLSREALPEAMENLVGTLAEDIKDLKDPDRFKITEGMSEKEKAEIYAKQLESVKTINKSLKTQGEVGEAIVEFFAGIKSASKAGKLLDTKSLRNILKSGTGDREILSIKELMTKEKNARQALIRYRLEKKLAGIDADLAKPGSIAKEAAETTGRTADDVLAELQKKDDLLQKELNQQLEKKKALDGKLQELEDAEIKNVEPSSRKFEPPEDDVHRLPDQIGDELGEGGFSKTVKNKKNPNEVIKYPVDEKTIAKYEEMIERQVEGNKILDELGVDNARITGKGTLWLEDGRKVPMLTQEAVDSKTIMKNIVNGENPNLILKEGGKLKDELQVQILDLVQRANERGILIGDLKWDNIYWKDGKLGFLDSDFIGKPKATALLDDSVEQMQWTQISGKVEKGDIIFTDDFVKNSFMENSIGGGSAGNMAQYLDDGLIDLIKEPDKLKAFLKEKKLNKVKEGLTNNTEYRKLMDESNGLSGKLDDATQKLNKASNQLEEGAERINDSAFLEHKPDTPDLENEQEILNSFNKTVNETKNAEELTMIEMWRSEGMPEEDIRKLLEPASGELKDINPPDINTIRDTTSGDDFSKFFEGTE